MEKPRGFPDNIILIGMFGSGKSTLGRLLANRLRYHFLDTDQVIEARFKKPLQKVLERMGMAGFMRLEEETLLSLHPRHCVVSTGGSAVYYPKAMRYLKTLGPRVYLKVPLAELKRRVPDFDERGTVRKGGCTLDALFRERGPLLSRYSDLTFKAHGKPWDKLANELLGEWGVRTGPPVTVEKDAKKGPASRKKKRA